MDAQFSRRRILTPEDLRALNQRSDLRGAVQMASHIAAILAAGALMWLSLGTLWVVPAGFVLGVLINFLYAAQHELSHGTVFATGWLNVLFGRIIGFLMIFPRDFDQIMHFAHHRHTQDWERDGELVREPYTLRTYLLWLFGVTYWWTRIARLARLIRGIVVEPYIRAEEEATVIREARLHVALYGLIAVISVVTGEMAALTFWLIPMVLTKPVHQLQNTIEHLGLSHEADILNNTRSTRTNGLMRWMCWQMPYHTAHHTFPSVPFWKLRDLNDRMEAVTGPVHRMGYLEFQVEVIRRLWSRSEAEYPQNEVWIIPRKGGRQMRLAAE